MADLPRGTVTFLFTDIEGSTRLWQEHPQAMASAIARHDSLLREATEAHGGVVFKTAGDAVCAAFPSAPAAVAAALDAQRALTKEAWGEVGLLRVRMALHTGQAEPRDGDYRGQPLNRLSRLLAATHGGQVVLSLPTAELVREALPPGAVLRDLGELPLKDLDRPERAVQLVHPDLQVTFPPPRVSTAPSHNLPLQATPFLGREAEVAQAAALLRDPAVRLLTLTGPGGVGKTRLALRVAADLLNEFPDGVWFVGLAPISDPALVVPMVARVLGVREGGDDTLVERIGAALRDKRLLLVLDNFEQVVEAAPGVAEVLAACPGLTVLVTSRVRLRLSGERECAVAPLSLPPADGSLAPERVAESEAVRLFVERARAVRSDFALTRENAESVAEVCRRLDGLPLALELAAARVKVFPPQVLLKRLERRLPLLTGGGRDLPIRQQTMWAAIAWSHDLLTPEEQTLFRRLAVFAGGATFDAIEAVASGAGGLDAVDLVASLVDKSLVRQEDGPGGEPRYRMLETVREFGLERLSESGEEEEVRSAQAGHFLALAEEVGTVVWTSHDPFIVERLEADLANLRAALVWFELTEQGDCLVRLVAALGFFWYLTGHHREGRAWTMRALRMVQAPTHMRARALCWMGLLTAGHDDEVALQHLEQAATLAHDLALRDEEALAVILQGVVLEDRGEYDAAEALFSRGLALFPRPHEHLDALKAIYHLGIVAYGRGEADRARRLWEEALAGAKALGDGIFAAWCLHYLALQAAEQGELGRAAAILEECLPLSHAAAYRISRGVLLATLAVLGSACGPLEAAARLLGAAEVADGRLFVPPEGEAYARAGERLRVALGAEVYEEALAAGREQDEETVDADARAVLTAAAAAPAPAPVSHDPTHGTGLTSRELEVLELLVDGKSNREIAEALFVSPRTVDNHVTNILAKLDVKSRTAAVAAARRLGLA